MNVKWFTIMCLLLLASGCKKDDPANTTTGTLPGSCSYTAAKSYTGAILAGGSPTAVTVEADLVNHPNDLITVILCRGADCNTTIPSTLCSTLTLPQLVTTPCKTTMPSVHIALARSLVNIVNAGMGAFSDKAHLDANIRDIPPYSNYFISEQLCQ